MGSLPFDTARSGESIRPCSSVGVTVERRERPRVRVGPTPRDTARRYRSVPVMIHHPAARRVRETAAGLPRCVTAVATGQVPEFKRRP
ncbi:hypothetical protein FU139_13920 [Burkholderia territorii]|nr:hypothetical protein FU139_13920 [Burkholderia territorii]